MWLSFRVVYLLYKFEESRSMNPEYKVQFPRTQVQHAHQYTADISTRSFDSLLRETNTLHMAQELKNQFVNWENITCW
jgi:hypothetical protein